MSSGKSVPALLATGAHRILIVGGPKVGKTTLAKKLAEKHSIPDGKVRHTDDLIDTHSWSDSSEVVSKWMDEPGPWLIEGVTLVRALRKWLAAHPDGRPADVLLFSSNERVSLTPRQRVMTSGLLTVWKDIRGELAARGLSAKSF